MAGSLISSQPGLRLWLPVGRKPTGRRLLLLRGTHPGMNCDSQLWVEGHYESQHYGTPRLATHRSITYIKKREAPAHLLSHAIPFKYSTIRERTQRGCLHAVFAAARAAARAACLDWRCIALAQPWVPAVWRREGT